MFRNHRSLWTGAMVVTVLLLATRPAAAAGGVARPTQVSKQAAGAWSGLWVRFLSWISTAAPAPRLATETASPDYSSNIDPNGQH